MLKFVKEDLIHHLITLRRERNEKQCYTITFSDKYQRLQHRRKGLLASNANERNEISFPDSRLHPKLEFILPPSVSQKNLTPFALKFNSINPPPRDYRR